MSHKVVYPNVFSDPGQFNRILCVDLLEDECSLQPNPNWVYEISPDGQQINVTSDEGDKYVIYKELEWTTDAQIIVEVSIYSIIDGEWVDMLPGGVDQ